MIYKVIACALVGILAHGFLTLELHEHMDVDEMSLKPAALALALAVVVEVIAWELLSLIGG